MVVSALKNKFLDWAWESEKNEPLAKPVTSPTTTIPVVSSVTADTESVRVYKELFNEKAQIASTKPFFKLLEIADRMLKVIPDEAKAYQAASISLVEAGFQPSDAVTAAQRALVELDNIKDEAEQLILSRFKTEIDGKEDELKGVSSEVSSVSVEIEKLNAKLLELVAASKNLGKLVEEQKLKRDSVIKDLNTAHTSVKSDFSVLASKLNTNLK